METSNAALSKQLNEKDARISELTLSLEELKENQSVSLENKIEELQKSMIQGFKDIKQDNNIRKNSETDKKSNENK